MLKSVKSIISIFIGLVATVSVATAFANIVVIGNPHLPFNHLTQTKIKRLFLLQPVSLHPEANVQVYDQPQGSPAYSAFYESFYHWDPSQVSNYWSSMVFNGEGNPPPTVDDDNQAIAVVEGTPGAISYIDPSALPTAQGHVKILYSDVPIHQQPRIKHTKPHVKHYAKVHVHHHVKKKPVIVKKIAVKKPVKKKEPPIKKAEIHKKPAVTVKAQITKTKAQAMQEIAAINASLHHKKAEAPVQQKKKQVEQAINWSQLISHFSLPSYANVPEVRQQIVLYVAHKDVLTKNLSHTELLLNVEKRHMPAEFALLPLVSKVQDENTTLDKLTNLHKQFNNWLLALAAYETSSATVQKVLQKNEDKDFWELNLPVSVKVSVSQLLALAQMIRYPEYYSLTLPKTTIEKIVHKKSVKPKAAAQKPNLQALLNKIYQK